MIQKLKGTLMGIKLFYIKERKSAEPIINIVLKWEKGEEHSISPIDSVLYGM